MKLLNPLTPIKFLAVRLWTHGLRFWESYILILTSALVLSIWLKWHLLHVVVISLAVAFYAITPEAAYILIKQKWQKRPSLRPTTVAD
jgi:hypothetical protein